MSKLIIHKTSKEFYKDKSYGNAYLSNSLREDLPLIKFRCFDKFDWMDACMTTRLGGISTGHLSSLNLGDERGDDQNNVYTNYIHVAESLDLSVDNIVKTDQVHGTAVSEVCPEHLPAGPKVRLFSKTDGVYTSLCNVSLCVGAADCVPILFVCTDIKAVCAVHSGWRGTVGRIGAVAVKKLMEKGANLECIVALIGPSICQDNYEVTEDVISAFKTSGFSSKQIKDIAYQTDDIHYQLDLWAACWHYLREAGLNSNNIHFSGVCTYENPDLLWSHRYTKGLRGNQNAIIWKCQPSQ